MIWRVTYSDGSFGYIVDGDTHYNAADGVLRLVADIEKGDKTEQAAWGVELCEEVGKPADPRLFRPSMDFDGLTVTHTADPLSRDQAKQAIVKSIQEKIDTAQENTPEFREASLALDEAIKADTFEKIEEVSKSDGGKRAVEIADVLVMN